MIWRGFFLILGGTPRFHSNFTDKALFFADLSVSKTHFTDKPSFSSDLSVNFWPLWWVFTDKAGFLERLSVKPGPKRLNFYGQTAVFDRFVRNRHFWNSPFTDKASIFIDVSVNGSDFAKCSTAHHLLNHGQNVAFRYFATFEVARAEFGADGRQKSNISPSFCLLSRPRTTILNQPVDKNHTFTPVFVYWPQRFKGDYGQRAFLKSARNPAQNAAAFTAFVK